MNRACDRWTKDAPRVAGAFGVLVALSAAACFSGGTNAGAIVIVTPRGCTVTEGGPPHVAPGGYYTNGATVCSADGTPHQFHGIDRDSLEFEPTGQNISLADFQAIAGWHANVVRIALNQDYWLSGAKLYSPTYQATVDQAVQWAESTGMDVILDLHWSDEGNLAVTVAGGSSKQDSPEGSNQQEMADVNSKQFWLEVATKYKGDGRVLFELYNEPNGIGWSVWLNGGNAGSFTAVGMQQLYDVIRDPVTGAGADNVVIAGGLNYAFDLSGVATNPIVGYNIMYATHPYATGDNNGMDNWPGAFGYLSAGDVAPVIATEFGDGSAMCTGAWDTSLIEFAKKYNNISWTAWAWYPGGCNFPSLIANWSYTPTVQGTAVMNELLQYPAPQAATPDAGLDATLGTSDASGGVTDDGALGDAGPPEGASDAAVPPDGAGDAGPASD